MHDLSFRFKRAHIRAVEFHKPFAAEFGLTPARFDAMYVIRAKGGVCRQHEIWEALGLSPSTICKMLKSMEILGLIWREPDEDDHRHRVVRLTKYGFLKIVAAIKVFIRTDMLRSFYDSIDAKGREFVTSLRIAAQRAARALFDSSTLAYRPDAPGVHEHAELDADHDRVARYIGEEEDRRNRDMLFPDYCIDWDG